MPLQWRVRSVQPFASAPFFRCPTVGVNKYAKGENEVRDVQNIADILVDPDGSKDRMDHWEKTGHSLLVGAILHVLYAEPDKTLTGGSQVPE